MTDYTRFIQQWVIASASDLELGEAGFPAGYYELPSPEIMAMMPVAELNGMAPIDEEGP